MSQSASQPVAAEGTASQAEADWSSEEDMATETRQQAPGSREQALGSRHQRSGTSDQAPGSRHQAAASRPPIGKRRKQQQPDLPFDRQELIIGSRNPVKCINDLGTTAEISKLAGQTTLAPLPRRTERQRQQKRIHRGCREALGTDFALHRTRLPFPASSSLMSDPW
ncbi:unnamed protein product [Merluccius merluccius]